MRLSPLKLARAALALAAILLVCSCGSDDVEAPYALRKDGKIIEIRNCMNPTDRGASTCAALICEQAIAESLVNPMEAKLHIHPPLDARDEGRTIVAGSIRYRTSISIPLPTGFRCELQGLELVDHELTKD